MPLSSLRVTTYSDFIDYGPVRRCQPTVCLMSWRWVVIMYESACSRARVGTFEEEGSRVLCKNSTIKLANLCIPYQIWDYIAQNSIYSAFLAIDRVGLLTGRLIICSLNMAFGSVDTISLSCDSLILNALSVVAEFLQRTRQSIYQLV